MRSIFDRTATRSRRGIPSGNGWYLALLMSLAHLSCLTRESRGEPPIVPTAELSSRIDVVAAAYKAPEPLTIRFTLTNETGAPLTVLKWHTPFEGFQGDIFEVTRDGNRVRYIGRTVKRATPGPDDYLTIPARRSVEAVVDLAQGYAIYQPGAYTVEFRATLLEYGTASPAELAAKPSFEPRTLRSNRLTLSVAEAREQPPSRPEPEPLPKTPPPASGKGPAPKAPAFKNCSASQQATLTTALANAQNYSAGSYLALALTAESKRPNATRYTTWFGTYDATRYQTVTDHILSIYNAFTNQTVTFNCGCTDNYYAYVYPDAPYEIYLCKVFWTAPAVGTDSQFGTLIHEMSHFYVVASTDDHVYGQTGCKNLANTNPANAIDNADSHEYFCENTPPLSMGLPLAAYSVILALIVALAYRLAVARRRS